jgi:hypothetical protein
LTAGKRLLDEEALDERALKKKKHDEQLAKARGNRAAAKAKELTQDGPVSIPAYTD